MQGRNVALQRTALGVARASFDELCAKPLGAADYLALAGSFHTLILSTCRSSMPTGTTRPGAS